MSDRKLSEHSTERPLPLMPMDTKALYESLINREPGSITPYCVFNDVIGRNVQKEARPRLYAARKLALKEKGLVFKPIIIDRGEKDPTKKRGLKCLTDHEKAHLGTGGLQRIHKSATRTAVELATVQDYDTLSQDDKLVHQTSMAALGAVREITRIKQIEKIKPIVQNHDGYIGYMKLLEEIVNQKDK